MRGRLVHGPPFHRADDGRRRECDRGGRRHIFDGWPCGDGHFASAALLFLILAFFCFFVFTPILPKHRLPNGALKPGKALRNRIYVMCGIAMLVAMAAIAAKIWFGDGWSFWTGLNLTFWLETFALWAFGVSWALKGRLGPFGDTAVGRMVIDPDDRRTPGDPPLATGSGGT